MTRPFSDMRPSRFLALLLLISGLGAGGVLVARLSLWLLLIYVPLAFFAWIVGDAGVIQRFFPLRRTRDEVATLLKSLVDGSATTYDWQSFVTLRIEDPLLDTIRVRLLAQAPRPDFDRARLAKECLDELTNGAA
jgi:hypothetical protein